MLSSIKKDFIIIIITCIIIPFHISKLLNTPNIVWIPKLTLLTCFVLLTSFDGVDITTYRAAIGVFYSVTHRSLSLPKLNRRFNFSVKLCCFYK